MPNYIRFQEGESMTVFNDYATMYDLFYKDKDYSAECHYVINLINKYSVLPISSILDIGCGTGGHALIWAKDGIDVAGLDMSPTMLKYAKEKASELKLPISFMEGDVRSFDIGRKFDAVTAMFAVMSYQTQTEEILSALRSVRCHLEPGGLFLFDVWSGPGVISDPPTERVRSFMRDGIEILRTVRPVHDVSSHVVKVHYDILCIKDEKILKRVKEVHGMRYLFPQEVADFASRTGFQIVTSEPFMKHGESLRVDDWNVMFVLRAV